MGPQQTRMCAAVISFVTAIFCGSTACAVEGAQVTVQSKTQAPDARVDGWSVFVDSIQGLPEKMLSKLPEHLRNDPQIQQEIGRLMLATISGQAMIAAGPDGDHPMFVPQINLIYNFFQPNADTVYREAFITPGGTYRLRGNRGSVRIAKIGAFAPWAAGESIHAREYYDLKELPTDGEGNFEVILSPERPRGYKGTWWKLDPEVTQLLLRSMAYDWAAEVDPTIAIERVDVPPNRPRPPAEQLRDRLMRVPDSIEKAALLLIGHVEQLRREGFVNKLKIWDVTANFGGLFGQFYYEGAYDIKDTEALILETSIPRECVYSSLILTNEIFETTDWYNNHSSLNGSQWHVDPDNRLRVVISAKDPGVKNWLDTAGYPVGVVQGRWTDCDSTPMPTIRKVSFIELERALPKTTARVSLEERDKIIRERRQQYQQRRLW